MNERVVLNLLYTYTYTQKSTTENSENPSNHTRQKRSSSPGSIVLPSAKRNALGDVTNNVRRVLVQYGIYVRIYILLFVVRLSLLSRHCFMIRVHVQDTIALVLSLSQLST